MQSRLLEGWNTLVGVITWMYSFQVERSPIKNLGWLVHFWVRFIGYNLDTLVIYTLTLSKKITHSS